MHPSPLGSQILAARGPRPPAPPISYGGASRTGDLRGPAPAVEGLSCGRSSPGPSKRAQRNNTQMEATTISIAGLVMEMRTTRIRGSTRESLSLTESLFRKPRRGDRTEPGASAPELGASPEHTPQPPPQPPARPWVAAAAGPAQGVGWVARHRTRGRRPWRRASAPCGGFRNRL